jgi:hypothetical protein
VLVLLNSEADGSVVVIPLGPSDGAVSTLVSEVLQELRKDLVREDLARADLRMVGAVERLSQFMRNHETGTVQVKPIESLVDDVLTLSIRCPP